MSIKLIKKLASNHVETRVEYDNDNEEFIVSLFVDGTHRDAADYYTDDRDDAIGTARLMLTEQVAYDELHAQDNDR